MLSKALPCEPTSPRCRACLPVSLNPVIGFFWSPPRLQKSRGCVRDTFRTKTAWEELHE